MRSLSFAVLLLGTMSGLVPAAVPDETIHLPPSPPPFPTPAPVPAIAVVPLSGTLVYDFRTTSLCDVSAYPSGLLTIKSDVVPANETLRIRDSFFDGATTRSYKGPCTVYFVTAAGTGTPQLTVTPIGLKDGKDIKRVVFDVKAGVGPIPPPKPPEPKPPVPVTSFRVFFVFESGQLLPPKQSAALTARAVLDLLDAKCTGGKNGHRLRDKDVVSVGDDTAALARFWTDVRGRNPVPPAVAFEVNGVVTVEPFPADTAATVELVTKRAEGK